MCVTKRACRSLLYGAAILLRADSWRLLINSVPWLLGSLGTVALDSTILLQSRWFGEEGPEEDSEDDGEEDGDDGEDGEDDDEEEEMEREGVVGVEMERDDDGGLNRPLLASSFSQ